MIEKRINELINKYNRLINIYNSDIEGNKKMLMKDLVNDVHYSIEGIASAIQITDSDMKMFQKFVKELEYVMTGERK